MLRALALYHGKSPVHLFMVRLAQGLCHAGKGTVTLSPAHSDRRLVSQPALAGLLVVLTAALDCKNSTRDLTFSYLTLKSPLLHCWSPPVPYSEMLAAVDGAHNNALSSRFQKWP